MNIVSPNSIITHIFFILLLLPITLFGQTTIDKETFTCNKAQYAGKYIVQQSTLTENQEKMDVGYYGLNLDLDFDNELIIGSVIVKGWVGMNQPDSLELDFTTEMTVDSVKFYGETWAFVHENNLLKIPAPDETIPVGYEFEISVYYSGTPAQCSSWGPFNFDSHNGIDHVWTLSEPYGARCWWPCKDDPSDKADSMDIVVTLPEEQIVVSNGLLISETNVGEGRVKYHWKESYPICTYLVSVTTYPYTVWHDEYIGLNGDTLPLDYYVYPDHYDTVIDNYLLTNDMMEVFAEKFGEYPFMGEKYGHVEFGRGGGMEHQTISSLGGHSQWLIAHELGHQWWGDLVTCASFHHIWLNEGFARFSEAIWEEAYNGESAYKNYWETHAFYGPGTIYVETPNSIGDIFNGNLTYNKAGWVVHMLRGVLGDSLFFESLQSYGANDSLAYGAATTENFRDVCESVSNQDLDYFFDQWIYGEYYPRYAISWESHNSEQLAVTIEQTQNWQLFQMPIQLQIITGFDTLGYVVNNQSQIETYVLDVLPSDIQSIKLDPDNWILKSVEYLSISELPSYKNITLYPAYPNPFNPETNLSIFIPDHIGITHAKINVFDIRGNLVGELWNDLVYPGLFTLNWKPINIASGTYFISVTTDATTLSQKIQLVK